jgi:hypothetical protein
MYLCIKHGLCLSHTSPFTEHAVSSIYCGLQFMMLCTNSLHLHGYKLQLCQFIRLTDHDTRRCDKVCWHQYSVLMRQPFIMVWWRSITAQFWVMCPSLNIKGTHQKRMCGAAWWGKALLNISFSLSYCDKLFICWPQLSDDAWVQVVHCYVLVTLSISF